MKPIGIDHFANFAFLNHLKVSDGGKAAFLIKRANLEENGYDSDLYLWRDGSAGPADRYREGFGLLLGRGGNLFPGYPEESRPGIYQKRLPLTVFYRLPLTGGEAVEAFRVKEKIKSVKFISPDEFYFVADYDPKAEWALENSRRQYRRGGCAAKRGSGLYCFRSTAILVKRSGHNQWSSGPAALLSEWRSDRHYRPLYQCKGLETSRKW